MPAPGELRRDRTGERYGRLIVVAFAGRTKRRAARWLCRCDCGVELTVIGDNLDAKTSSCGCRRVEVTTATSTTHGHAGGNTPEYESWCAMLARIRATSGQRYRYYGARGITVCERWFVFENFLADMGTRPAGTSLDRINNDGNYEPGNCRWATPVEQARNRRPRRKSVERAVNPEGGST